MTRRLWVLLGWSAEYGVAIIPVAVLGADVHETAVSMFVEWVPREYEPARVWRERIATTNPDELTARMAVWEDTQVASAVEVDLLLPSAELADEVRAQVDDIVGSAR